MNNTKTTSGIAFLCLFICLIFFSGISHIPTFSTAETQYNVPILMYHSIGEKTGEYVISQEMFEKDLIKIKNAGYETITSADLIAFKEQGIPLPEKSVIIAFDDGYFNNYTYAFPLLKKYNMKAILSVVGKFSEEYNNSSQPLNNNYSHIIYSQIREMSDSGLIEIANHSYDLHSIKSRRGILRKKGESYEAYKSTLIGDVEKCNDILKNNCYVSPIAFTYPFGCVNKESSEIINSMGFKVTYGCEEGINKITQSHTLKELKRYNRHKDFDISKLLYAD